MHTKRNRSKVDGRSAEGVDMGRYIIRPAAISNTLCIALDSTAAHAQTVRD